MRGVMKQRGIKAPIMKQIPRIDSVLAARLYRFLPSVSWESLASLSVANTAGMKMTDRSAMSVTLRASLESSRFDRRYIRS